MSYEPTLIISRDDLRRAEDQIHSYDSKNGSRKVKSQKLMQSLAANTYLSGLLREHGVKFKDDWIILCRPELTSHNRAVRDMLDYYSIEYAVFD